MDPRHLTRLQEEQLKAISETGVKIEQLEHFKQDYKSVQDRLRTLPDKLTHDAMVPFGKLAFMPGRLTHTNEILVLLGDNWFVERSAKQAVDIIDRRVQELDKKLTDLKAQQKLLQPRLNFTSDLQAEIQGHGDVKEIVEEFDESKEKLWDEQHRQNVKKYREELRRNTESQNSPKRKDDRQDALEKTEDSQKTDEYLWSRLDELEKQEVQRGELRSFSDGEDNEDEEKSQEKAGSENLLYTERRVSWADKLTEKEIPQDRDKSSGENTDDDDEDDDDADSEADDDDDGDEETRMPRNSVRTTISFKHSPTSFVLPHQVSEGGDATIHSPADIYKLYCPKSILKKTVDNEGISDGIEKTEFSQQNVDNSKQASNEVRGYTLTASAENEPQNIGFSGSQSIISSSSGANKAFTGFVVEKVSNLPATSSSNKIPASSAATGTSAGPAPPKRVSKFKASRQT